MKQEVKQEAGLKTPKERMGNCLQRRFSWPNDTQEEYGKPQAENSERKKFRKILKRKKKEFHKESEDGLPCYQEKHEGNTKEPFYALIMHEPQRRPSTNSTEYCYENVLPNRKRTMEQPAHGQETEYASLRIPSSPQPSYSSQDEEYELIMPFTSR